MAASEVKGAGSDYSDDFLSSDEEGKKGFSVKSVKKAKFDRFNEDEDEEEDEQQEENVSSDDDEGENVPVTTSKTAKTFIDKAAQGDDDDDDDQYFGFLSGDENEDDADAGNSKEVEETARLIEKNITGTTTFGTKKVKKLTPEQLAKEEKKIKKTGVVYLSSLPPYMKPQKLRQIMSRFGEVGRIFLKPEDPKVYKSRIKQGGNKKKKFDEGWVEFTNKLEAKLAADTLNGNILGGKKRSFYHDDVMNVKYLKGFKWFDLTNALNREIEVRESKKQAELSQANKLNKAFIKNVETSKTINRIQESKKRKHDADGETNSEKTEGIRRTFKQRNVATNRADADSSIKNKTSTDSSINSVLNSIF